VTIGLTGCQTYGQGQPVANDPIGTELPTDPESAAAQEPAPGSTALEDPPAEGQPGGEVLTSLGDLPVGGGVIFANQGVVVTHPKEGVVKAFSTICTHAGCPVNEVSGGTINCSCHGSKFKVTDGSPVAGPANGPLQAVKVVLDGDNVRLA
jgi:Rieske Fe-S protein